MASKTEVPTASLDRGNFVSEWFGHRVYPVVADTPQSLADQRTNRCPFLSMVLEERRECVKSPAAKGICDISSSSNGVRQDWLVCPYRALDPMLIDAVTRRLFRLQPAEPLLIVPGPTLARPDVQAAVNAAVSNDQAVFFYLQDKLGGEISIPQTDRSPELSFDITIARIEKFGGLPTIRRYGILEVQTMDFHGKYSFVVSNLRDALRLHGDGFHAALRQNPRWLSEKIEGPNIANVFKRTFYQVMLKFQVATEGSCTGAALAIPASVWDSWQRHLGRPDLVASADGTFRLQGAGGDYTEPPPAWIFVFDTEPSDQVTPNPLKIRQVIGTNAESVGYYALKVAPEAAVAGVTSVDRVLMSIKQRVTRWWPSLSSPAA